MHLYQGTSEQFIADAVQARLANQLAERFFQEFRYKPAPSEVTSWQNSLGAMAKVLQLADLREQGVLVELKLPLSSKRLDVLITGQNPTTGDAAVVVELKQWTTVGRSNITDCVTVDMGGREIDHLHPSRQVAQYQRYLQDTHPAFTDGGVALDACAYLHYATHDPTSPLYHADFASLLATNPSFSGDQLDALATYLDQRVAGPDEGGVILDTRRQRGLPPHKRLLDHVARVIRNEPAFTLLDEQQVAYNAIMDSVRVGRPEPAQGRVHRRGRARDREVGHRGQPRRRAGRRSASGRSTSPARRRSPRTSARSSAAGRRAVQVLPRHRDRHRAARRRRSSTRPTGSGSVSTSRFTPASARTGKAQIDDILDSSGCRCSSSTTSRSSDRARSAART